MEQATTQEALRKRLDELRQLLNEYAYQYYEIGRAHV